MSGSGWQRRARPLLGTLVDIAAAGSACHPDAIDAIDAAFAAVAAVQAQLSRFESGSDVARFNALGAGASLAIGAHAQAVLAAAQQLAAASGGRFDVALGSGAWSLQGGVLHKHDAGTQLDLGGIAKGHAVDCAVAALQAAGCSAGCVNAGGDLRCFGAPGVDLQLRDETSGAVRRFGRLHDGACATSHFAPGSRSALVGAMAGAMAGAASGASRHVSVLAPTCLWADALTKVVALGDAHGLLQACGARAWVHCS